MNLFLSSEEEARKKLRNLRNYFVQNLNAYEGSIKSGAEADEVKQPTWKFFQMLMFLRPCVKQHKPNCQKDYKGSLKAIEKEAALRIW
ncbi:hypothetical protein BaRGS_00016386 [Batillaria attramentaria]|uniref:MADF domain-containing protein n=1 Tax=Batillaria attramentaria TaxID=370345 RepID=A0ABD0KYN1_9CAEN